jgi:hypothetical protein
MRRRPFKFDWRDSECAIAVALLVVVGLLALL